MRCLWCAETPKHKSYNKTRTNSVIVVDCSHNSEILWSMLLTRKMYPFYWKILDIFTVLANNYIYDLKKNEK